MSNQTNMESLINDIDLSESDLIMMNLVINSVWLNTPFLQKIYIYLHFFCLAYIKNVKPKKIEEEYDLKIEEEYDLKILELLELE